MEIEFDDDLNKEISEIVRRNPKNYVKILKSRDKSRLLEYIYKCTPLLDDSTHRFKTRLYWVLNRLTDFPLCKGPGEPHRLLSSNVKSLAEGYPDYCGSECMHRSPEYFKSCRDGVMKKYGVENAFQIDSVKEGLASRKDEIQAKRDATYARHYGSEPGRNISKSLETRIARYGSAWNISKIKAVKAARYGNPAWNNPAKNSDTKSKNGTYGQSAQEQIVYEVLRSRYGRVLRQHKSGAYPYRCDFYIPSEDMYIEYNGSWTHGGRPFVGSAEDAATLEKWKAAGAEYYDNAVTTWTVRDPAKRKAASDAGLNFHEIWNIRQFEEFMRMPDGFLDMYPVIPYSKALSENELAHWKSVCASDRRLAAFSGSNCLNYNVKFFQQDMFYADEKRLWLDPAVRARLIENRTKYLGKPASRLTPLDCLDGFKRSGIHYGYSHFNPQWFAAFVRKYGCRSCYDPCGGWGHRVMGSFGLERYIYNDRSPTVKHNIDRMTKKLGLGHVETHCEDAREFVPNACFDSMFTCPPYFNLEKYECGGFSDMREYGEFVDSLFRVFNSNEKCRVFGLVIREDLMTGRSGWTDAFEMPVNRAAHLCDGKKHREVMYVFRKLNSQA